MPTNEQWIDLIRVARLSRAAGNRGSRFFLIYAVTMTLPDLSDQSVCVTGGAGFIGSHLVESLVRAGAQVRVLDDFSSGDPGNLSRVASEITLIEGTILDTVVLQQALAGTNVVFHHAARVSVAESVVDPVAYGTTNVMGTLAVLEAARQSEVNRLVYAGSCSAYGDLPGLPKCEDAPVHPTSPYAATKLAGEDFVAAYPGSYPLDTARLRYFNVYGPRQAHDSPYAAVVPKFFQALSTGEEAVIFGDGGQTRDFVHVEDVVQANILAAFAPEPLEGAVFNVGSGERRSILEVCEQVAGALGVPCRVRFEPARSGEVRDSEASIDRAAKRLGYRPRRAFADALGKMVEASA